MLVQAYEGWECKNLSNVINKINKSYSYIVDIPKRVTPEDTVYHNLGEIMNILQGDTVPVWEDKE